MLALTRRVGEAIRFTYLDYPAVLCTLVDIQKFPTRQVTVRVEDTSYLLLLSSLRESREVWLNLFDTQMVSLRLIDAHNDSGLQARIGIVAPQAVAILRDNAKLKEPRHV